MSTSATPQQYADCDRVIEQITVFHNDLRESFVDAVRDRISDPSGGDDASDGTRFPAVEVLCRRLQDENAGPIERLTAATDQPVLLAPKLLAHPMTSLLADLKAHGVVAFEVIKVFDDLLRERLPWIYGELSRHVLERHVESVPAVAPSLSATDEAEASDRAAQTEATEPRTPQRPATMARGMINRLVIKHRVPDFVDAFLAAHWVPVIERVMSLKGQNVADLLQHRRDTARAVCWCASPTRAAQDRGKIEALLPKLDARLRRGIEETGGDPAPVSEFVSKLEESIGAGLRRKEEAAAVPVIDFRRLSDHQNPIIQRGVETRIAPGRRIADKNSGNTTLDLYEGLSVTDIELNVSEESLESARSGAGEAVNLETLFTSTLSGLSIDQEMFAKALDRSPDESPRDTPEGSEFRAGTAGTSPLSDGNETSALFRVVQRDGDSTANPETPPDGASPKRNEE